MQYPNTTHHDAVLIYRVVYALIHHLPPCKQYCEIR